MSRKRILSLSIDPDKIALLKTLAAKKYPDANVSRLVTEMVEKYLVSDEGVVPVILKIPVALKGNHDGLKSWLDQKCTAVIKALSPQ